MHINQVISRTLFVLVGACLLPFSGTSLQAAGKRVSSKSHFTKLKKSKKKSSDSSTSESSSTEGCHGCCMGAAYGPKDECQNIDLVASDLNDSTGQSTTYLAPLWNGSPKANVPGTPFTFYKYQKATDPQNATGAFFLIHEEGQYLLQYGLTAIPNVALLHDLWDYLPPTATVWMAIQIENQNSKTFVGAVPLALTLSQSFDIHNPATNPAHKGDILSGFGQIPVKLYRGDQVSLRIFVGSQYDTDFDTSDRILYIHNDNINLPYTNGDTSAHLTRGPTLAITKMN